MQLLIAVIAAAAVATAAAVRASGTTAAGSSDTQATRGVYASYSRDVNARNLTGIMSLHAALPTVSLGGPKASKAASLAPGAYDGGCEFDEAGFVTVDATGRTSAIGVWAAGNVADPRAQVITAAGAGSAAAIAINADLVQEDVERAEDRRAPSEFPPILD